MSQTEVQLIKNNAVVEADIANDAVTRDKINVVSTSSAPGIEIKGDDGSQEGYLQLNCRVNSHGVKIQSPPHSASQSYKIILPDNQIAADKILKVKSISGSGSTATGQLEFADAAAAGVTEVDEWRFNADFNRQATADVTANWERADTAFDKIGTGMSESSGIFTFPSAGIWAIDAQINTFSTVGLSSWIELSMSYSTDSGGSFTDYLIQTYSHVDYQMGYYAYNTQTAHGVIDVLDASTWRVKFRLGAANNSIRFSGNTSNKTNNFRFVKLGDT